ncbi:MAG: hemolysin family protein [Candidatus Omnitrophota bacterium]
MPAFIILILIFITLAFFSAFFSASETAIIALSKIRLRHLVQKGVKHAKDVQKILTKLDKFIAAILIGNNFVNIAMTSISTAIFVYFFGSQWGVIFSTLGTTFFLLIFCEITPKIFAAQHSEKISLLFAPLMEKIINLFSPITHLFTNLTNFILKIFGGMPSKRSPLITEEELRLMIEVGKEEGVLSDEERKMLHRIFEFGDTKVSSVMVPRENIIAMDIDSDPEKLLDILVEEGHARIPVYKDSIDNIIGIIYARDLLYIWKNKGLIVLADLMHPAYYVLPEKRVNELLREFQHKKIQIAIVIDKNNKAQGVVTLEDLLEEIVGEIEEEVGVDRTR